MATRTGIASWCFPITLPFPRSVVTDMVRPSPHGWTVGARVRGASRAARDEAAKAFFVELGMEGRLVDWLRFGLPTPRIDAVTLSDLLSAGVTAQRYGWLVSGQ
jgi:hypothetical protein